VAERQPRISGTARNMAAFRALESAKPAGERLFSDPYATHFLSPTQRFLVACSRLSGFRRLVEGYADRRAPGARTSGIARTRLIDDWINQEIENGAGQLVVLGAGFDTRALRLRSLAKTRVIEIDRPAMIAYKNRVLGAEGGDRQHLARVQVDFLKDSLGECLLKADYKRSLKTLFLWEGVTNYLDDGSVAAVFAFVAANAPPGSRIVFTYIHSDAVDGRFDAPGLHVLLASLRRSGEPWTFGFDPGALPAYLDARGLKLVLDLGAAEYRRLYWKAMPERAIGYEFYRAALAEITGHAEFL
jgi:methyltransferase (TIGR00027 family)